MVDLPNFSARLDFALTLHGLDNSTFAEKFDPDGQQKVHNWRKRGRIGQQSVPTARKALPRIRMEWLNEGDGDPIESSPPSEKAEALEVAILALVALTARWRQHEAHNLAGDLGQMFPAEGRPQLIATMLKTIEREVLAAKESMAR